MPWWGGYGANGLSLDNVPPAHGDALHDDAIPLHVLMTGVKMDDALAEAFNAEQRRAENDEGDCEGAQLSPPPSPPRLPAATLPSMSSNLMRPAELALPFQPAPPGSGSQSARARAGKAARQRNRRRRLGEAFTAYEYKMRSSLSKKWSSPHAITAKRGSLGFAKGAYVGRRMKMPSRMLWTLPMLKKFGFKVVEWDGQYVPFRFTCRW